MPAKKTKEITEELRHGVKPYALKKGEKFMSKKQRTHFNLILSNWKQEIEEELERTVHHIQDEVLNLPDPTDRASQETDMSLELRSRDRERKLLKKLNEAVGRIESEEYGYCEKCGEEIGVKRLEARPTAELCIDCKTLDEIRERQIV